MYYGYNSDKELILADKEFIELLGFISFEELKKSDIMSNLIFENKQIVIREEKQLINATAIEHEIYGVQGVFSLVELKDIEIKDTKEGSKPQKALKTSYEPIYLDVEKISKEIGLSVEDYKLYLDSFIDQSIIDEKRLLEGNDKVIKNLANLALTLKIPHINIILLKIQKLPHRERIHLIDEYYTKLALLTLERPKDYKEELVDDIFELDNNTEKKEEILSSHFSELLQNKKTEPIKKEEELISVELPLDEPKSKAISEAFNREIQSHSEIKKISLDNITPLPISYNPQTAADELNLPVVLIEEFVDDFIEQAHHDKDHLLASYYQKDMDNIHELGHKLKGAASNLRINELADILEEIQFCTEHEKLEGLFKEYWGHFLSLEDYMKQLKRA